MTEDKVELEEGEVVPFDGIVICTGASYSGGVWRDDEGADAKREAISRARSVLVVGGGATGCEAAGYLAEHQCPKGVRIGLCHRSDKLIPAFAGAHERVFPYLKKLGVEMHLNTAFNDET